MRNTKHQEAVLNFLKEAEKAVTADQIREGISEKINKTTVYRMLDRFVEADKVHFVTGQDGKAYYALCQHQHNSKENHLHNHLHFQCNQCGKVECLPEKIQVPRLKEYHVEETQLLLIGTCKRCKI
ncbi:Fur family transcriptional regulator [Zunongwangia sp.]|uniref:Fur family transcriptional regulator n=1 Tax=Zunongwangia sp. TaxID=1965325 RepID=UPI003AA9DBDC